MEGATIFWRNERNHILQGEGRNLPGSLFYCVGGSKKSSGERKDGGERIIGKRVMTPTEKEQQGRKKIGFAVSEPDQRAASTGKEPEDRERGAGSQKHYESRRGRT